MRSKIRREFESLSWTFATAASVCLGIAGLPSAANALTLGSPPAPYATQSTSVSSQNYTSGSGAIADGSSVAKSSQVMLAKPVGFGTSLWDVDIHVTINHPRPQDLKLILIAPNGGRVVTLSTNNGGTSASAYQARLFDDSAAVTVTDPVVLGAAGASVAPEGALTSLQYIDPWGAWELQVSDGDGGFLSGGATSDGWLESWSIDATVLDPGYSLVRYGPTTSVDQLYRAIPNNGGTLIEPLFTGGMGLNLAEVRVFVKLTHAMPSQLEIVLSGPNIEVPLSLHNGQNNSNAFNGTLWYDAARDSSQMELLTTDANYLVPAGVAQSDLVPEGALGNFIGEDPNGGFALKIKDTVPNDGLTGALLEVDITCWTFDPPPIAANCISGTSANGCVPVLSMAGGWITASSIDGVRTGLLFYGINGQQVTAWGPNSTMCVKAPYQRTPVINTGGQMGGCNGSTALNWAAYKSANPTALFSLAAPGSPINMQLWWRDPASIKTTQLSNVFTFAN